MLRPNKSSSRRFVTIPRFDQAKDYLHESFSRLAFEPTKAAGRHFYEFICLPKTEDGIGANTVQKRGRPIQLRRPFLHAYCIILILTCPSLLLTTQIFINIKIIQFVLTSYTPVLSTALPASTVLRAYPPHSRPDRFLTGGQLRITPLTARGFPVMCWTTLYSHAVVLTRYRAGSNRSLDGRIQPVPFSQGASTCVIAARTHAHLSFRGPLNLHSRQGLPARYLV